MGLVAIARPGRPAHRTGGPVTYYKATRTDSTSFYDSATTAQEANNG